MVGKANLTVFESSKYSTSNILYMYNCTYLSTMDMHACTWNYLYLRFVIQHLLQFSNKHLILFPFLLKQNQYKWTRIMLVTL